MNIWQKLFSRKSLNRKTGRAFVILALLLFISFAASLLLGSTRASALEALRAAMAGQLSNSAYRIMAYVRLPRCCAAVLAGSALAVAGVIIQAVLNNAMAAPNIIGVNAGAGLLVALSCALIPSAVWLTPLTAFLGAHRELGAVVSSITGMYPCYEAQSSAAAVTLVPAWCVQTATGLYYVNCSSGAVTHG